MINRFYNTTEIPEDVNRAIERMASQNDGYSPISRNNIFNFNFGQTYYCGRNSLFNVFRVDKIILRQNSRPMYAVHDSKGNKYILFGFELGRVFEKKEDYLNYLVHDYGGGYLSSNTYIYERFDLPFAKGNSSEPIAYFWSDRQEADILSLSFDALWLDNKGTHYVLSEEQYFCKRSFEFEKLYIDKLDCIRDNFSLNDNFEEDEKEPKLQTFVVSINVSVEAMTLKEAQEKVEEVVNSR